MSGTPRITWESKREPVTLEAIATVEGRLGVHLPADYVACALVNHGARPEPGSFVTPRGRAQAVDRLCSLSAADPHHIVAVYEQLAERLPAGVYPFARGARGDWLCFDYGPDGASGPTVVLFDHAATERPGGALTDQSVAEHRQQAIIPLFATFTELLASLYDLN